MSVYICDDAIVEFSGLSADVESFYDFLRCRIGLALAVHSSVEQGGRWAKWEYYTVSNLPACVVSHEMGPINFTMISRKNGSSGGILPFPD